jgi:outer membrane protein assembly factor BamB
MSAAMNRPLTILAGVALVASAIAHPQAANWPGWRGPGGQGVSPEADVPRAWSPTTNVAWKSAVPEGHSQPITWGTRVFITAAIEGAPVPGASAPEHRFAGEVFKHPDAVGADRRHTLKVLAFDLESGRLLWERVAYEGTVYDDRHRRSSYAAPTPVTDGTRVYAYFGPQGLYAYDLDGTPAWNASVGAFALVGMGTGTSPVLWNDRLIIQRDENEGKESLILAFDTATGKEAWRTKRPVQASWSTPVVVEANGRAEVITNGNEFIIAYDPATGAELWRTKGVESNAIHTPLVGHGLVIVTAGFPEKRVVAIRPGGSGDITGSDRIVWQYDRGTAYVASPILHGDYVYLVSDKGILTCLDARTGEVKYEGGRVPEPGTFMASPVAFGDTLLLTSTDGDTYVIKAGPVHEVLGSNAVGEPVHASLAISQGRILVRGTQHLYCITKG